MRARDRLVVQTGNVGALLPDRLERRAAVADLGDDIDLRIRGQGPDDALAPPRMNGRMT